MLVFDPVGAGEQSWGPNGVPGDEMHRALTDKRRRWLLDGVDLPGGLPAAVRNDPTIVAYSPAWGHARPIKPPVGTVVGVWEIAPEGVLAFKHQDGTITEIPVLMEWSYTHEAGWLYALRRVTERR